MPAPLHPDFLRLPIAHRALHDRAAGRPENSHAAIRAAVQAGYGIEIDLQPSAEGVPMVFHDYDLKRLTGQPGPIRSRSAADLGALPLLGGEDGIPTLAEVLALVAGKVPLLVEIKDQDGAMGPDTGGFEATVAEVLAGYEGPLAVMSFNPHAVTAFAAAAPDVAVGLTTSAYDPADWAPLPASVCDRLREIPDYTSSGASFISHEHGDLSRPRVAELHASGAAILCWTIRSPEAEAAARTVAQNITFEGYAAPFPA
ncbi:glycerophosphodiester phosphodiesterase family protein [Frigidibacter sp.]|uniref:glycerophosphodiester phosphodiesterase family protein n=1 Tax=Frigidibacter sp. TaxID=2586418 RepID=UPI0027370A3A|nr:glycerophosphodiester phosphodiesterase family protein [Frigidibacter sp.]MDP3341631.1 glycerophosphodiester phosphodiesterase family protein [Frigidibacter sp.]